MSGQGGEQPLRKGLVTEDRALRAKLLPRVTPAERDARRYLTAQLSRSRPAPSEGISPE